MNAVVLLMNMSLTHTIKSRISSHLASWVQGTILAIACASVIASPVLAQSVPSATALDPLESLGPDPLLPNPPIDGQLTPQEQSSLSTAVDALDREAADQYKRGNTDAAIELWLRVARLRRYLGVEGEVASLTELGEAAWQDNRTAELQAANRRLVQIEQDTLAQSPLNYDLLQSIAQGYEAMRDRPHAVATYQILLAQAQQQQDVAETKRILTKMGELQLAWFDYTGAGSSYEQLHTLAQQTGDQRTEQLALEQLVTIYQENQDYELAIIAQTDLLNFYNNRKDQEKIAPLKIAIAENYMAIDRPDLAATAYQEAFAAARAGEQLGYASDALQGLGSLYLTIDRLDDARTVYELLVDVERQSYSQYGMMFAYDRIGQIYRVQGAKSQAIVAFQQGLQLAQQLNYREDYFAEQIQNLQQPTTP